VQTAAYYACSDVTCSHQEGLVTYALQLVATSPQFFSGERVNFELVRKELYKKKSKEVSTNALTS